MAMIEDLGVSFVSTPAWATDVTLEELRDEGFEAFFLAIGAHDSFKLGIPAKRFPQVHAGHRLSQARGPGRPPACRASNVVVIGGGNVAIDAARTCLRLGCRSVTLAYRRTRAEMPADVEEIEQAEEEGVRFDFLTIPVAIEGRGGRLTGLRCLQGRTGQKAGSDRKFPVPIEGSDLSCRPMRSSAPSASAWTSVHLSEIKDLTWTRRDTIQVHTATMETNVPGIFAAGDAVTGPATVVEAIGGGKRAAAAIDRYLNGYAPTQHAARAGPAAARGLDRSAGRHQDGAQTAAHAVDQHGSPAHHLSAGGTGVFREHGARGGAALPALRHLPPLRIVRGDLPRQDGRGRPAAGLSGFRSSGRHRFPGHPGTLHRLRRLRRQLPNDAMRMEDRKGERVLHLCGTILNRQPLLYCDGCGAVIGTGALPRIRARPHPQSRRPTIGNRLCEMFVRASRPRQRSFRVMRPDVCTQWIWGTGVCMSISQRPESRGIPPQRR
jgi:thioredoxin reductase